MKNKIYVVLPDYHFKNETNYFEFWQALSELECSSREIPDLLSKEMGKLFRTGDLSCFFIPHWHQMTNGDDDQRSIRNMLQADNTGTKPKRMSRNCDLLRYISLCLQYENEKYAAYVQQWRINQELCVDDEDEEGWRW